MWYMLFSDASDDLNPVLMPINTFTYESWVGPAIGIS